MNNINGRRNKLVGAAGIFLIILLAVAAIAWYKTTFKGYVDLNLNLPDISSTTVELNGQSLALTGTSDTFHLTSGNYNLSITRPGYMPFSTSFKLHRGQTILINGQLQLSSQPVLNSVSQFGLPGINAQNAQIISTVFFFNMTWAVSTIQVDGSDTAIVVAQYNAASQTWKVQLGPGTAFASGDISNLPVVVINYLSEHNYVTSLGN